MLPLESKKFRDVIVSHYDLTHTCHVTQSIFVPIVGLHDLLRMQGTINGHKVNVVIDDSATHSFLKYSLVKKL